MEGSLKTLGILKGGEYHEEANEILFLTEESRRAAINAGSECFGTGRVITTRHRMGEGVYESILSHHYYEVRFMEWLEMDLLIGHGGLILVDRQTAISERRMRMYPYQGLDEGLGISAYVARQMAERAFIALKPGFRVKASDEKIVLCNLGGGSKFELDPEQLEFLEQCDGTKRRCDILDQYDPESQEVVRGFMANLYEVGALVDRDEPMPTKVSVVRVKAPRLEMVHFEPYANCNMTCIHCYQGERYNRRRDNLTLDEMKGIILQMQEMGVDGVSISGGEPFINLEILDAVRLMEEHGIRAQAFFTNGTLLTKQLIKDMRKLESHPTFFVSFDGYTGHGMNFRGFNHIKGEQAVEAITKTIRRLTYYGYKVVVNTVLNCDNFLDLERIHDLMKRLRVDSWRVGYPKRTGTFASKDFQGFEIRFDRALRRLFELLKYHFQQKKPFDLQIEYLYRAALLRNFKKVADTDYVCDYEGRRESCCIKPNGDVVACAYCCDQVLGNVKKQSLAEIWYSPAMRAVKDLRVQDIEECKDCDLRELCATGCRANACFLGGEFGKSKDKYACDSVKFFKEFVEPFVRSQT